MLGFTVLQCTEHVISHMSIFAIDIYRPSLIRLNASDVTQHASLITPTPPRRGH